MNFTLKQKMLLGVVGAATVCFGTVLGLNASKSIQLAHDQAVDAARAEAQSHALRIEAELNKALNTARGVAFSLQGLNQKGFKDREMVNGMLRQVLENTPDVLAAYTGWEPDAFDGKDKTAPKTNGTDAAGRFMPYWNRGSGALAVEPLTDYDKPGTGDYYLLPKQRGKESLINPYIYPVGGKDVLMTSFVVPITKDGKFAGIGGVDMSLAALQATVGKIRPLETGYASLIANNGAYVTDIVATNANQDIGKDEASLGIKKKIAEGQSFELSTFSSALNAEATRIFVPVKVGDTESPWSLVVTLPTAKLFAAATQLARTSALLGLGGLVLMACVLYYLLNRLTGRLQSVAVHLNDSADQLSGAARQVSKSSDLLAAGASSQAASLEETSASLHEIASMTSRNNEHAQTAKELARQARQTADVGFGEMREMSNAMHEIKAASNSIAKIVRSIDEIAFQTNILALNAAVEAARAGEAGAGFAVVADEVRNLALRSALAARETSEQIEDAIKKSDRGADLSQRVTASLEQIVGQIRKTSELVEEIANASGDQKEGISQVSSAMLQIEKVNQGNAAHAEESASASEELNGQARELREMVVELKTLVEGQASTTTVQPVEPQKKASSEVKQTNGPKNQFPASAMKETRKAQTFADFN